MQKERQKWERTVDRIQERTDGMMEDKNENVPKLRRSLATLTAEYCSELLIAYSELEARYGLDEQETALVGPLVSTGMAAIHILSTYNRQKMSTPISES